MAVQFEILRRHQGHLNPLLLLVVCQKPGLQRQGQIREWGVQVQTGLREEESPQDGSDLGREGDEELDPDPQRRDPVPPSPAPPVPLVVFVSLVPDSIGPLGPSGPSPPCALCPSCPTNIFLCY